MGKLRIIKGKITPSSIIKREGEIIQMRVGGIIEDDAGPLYIAMYNGQTFAWSVALTFEFQKLIEDRIVFERKKDGLASRNRYGKNFINKIIEKQDGDQINREN